MLYLYRSNTVGWLNVILKEKEISREKNAVLKGLSYKIWNAAANEQWLKPNQPKQKFIFT